MGRLVLVLPALLRSAERQRFVGEEAERYWMGGDRTSRGGVDLYVGGTEHAVLHLLYARFWHKVLFDLGHLSTPEPFQRLVNQGIILGEDNQKMSKRWGNVDQSRSTSSRSTARTRFVATRCSWARSSR